MILGHLTSQDHLKISDYSIASLRAPRALSCCFEAAPVTIKRHHCSQWQADWKRCLKKVVHWHVPTPLHLRPLKLSHHMQTFLVWDWNGLRDLHNLPQVISIYKLLFFRTRFSECREKGLQLVSVCLELAAIRSYLFKLLQAANKHRSRGKIKHWKRP